jgi:hypothetical protein
MRVTKWALALVLLLSASRAGADLQWLGVHGAYYDQYEKGAIGVNARESAGHLLSVGLKVDYIFRPRRTTWAVDVDLQYDLPLGLKNPLIWVGGGAGVIHDDPQGPIGSDNYPTATGFVGVGYQKGPWLPYFEVRATSQERSRLVLNLGLRF